MNWIFLALAGAFFQAIDLGIKKKSLEVTGMNNVIAAVAFTFGAVLFLLVFHAQSGTWFWEGTLSREFWVSMGWYVGLNVLAVWLIYRALDLGKLNYLAPFLTLTTILAILPSFLLLGEFPTIIGFVGIFLVVAGAFWMGWEPKSTLGVHERKALWYFLGAVVCYSLVLPYQKIAVQESSVAFASFLAYASIGACFLTILILTGETGKLRRAVQMRPFLMGVLLIGLIVFLENGAINIALTKASVANAFAIKRLMPFFAFVIGYVYFKERENVAKKLYATTLMVVGAVLVTLFG